MISIDDFIKQYGHVITSKQLRDLALINMMSHEVRPDGVHFVNDPDDPGGATNFGISLRFLNSIGLAGDIDGDGDVDADDIRAMTLERAGQIYIKHFWEDTHIDQLPPRLAVKVFDMAVNMGPKQAIKILQRTLNAIGHTVAVDGVIGPQTLKAIDAGFAADHLMQKLMDDLRLSVGAFYDLLVKKHPVFQKYQRGWQRRAES